jgi:glycosyltransferase involved in cell wall biosynthesis
MKKVVFVFDQVRHFHVDLFRQLEQRLASRGIELHLIRGSVGGDGSARRSTDQQVIARESTFRLRDWRIGPYTLRLGAGYLPEVRRLRPAVVVCSAHPGDLGHWRLGSMKRRVGFRLVAWQCGYEYNPGLLKSALTRRFVPRFDLHLAYHSNARDYALRHRASAEQVVIIHNTIDEAAITRLDRQEARARLARLHPEIGDRRIVLFVGILLAEKRVEALIDAMAVMGRDDRVLVVVGAGPHLNALREHADGRGDVVFAGEVIDGVGAYFDAADVYALPGTGGLGINEAMAHGLPVVAGYADGSTDDLVEDGENGYRLRGGGAEELADRLSRILDDDDVRMRMGARSLERITGPFKFQSFLDRVEAGLVRMV